MNKIGPYQSLALAVLVFSALCPRRMGKLPPCLSRAFIVEFPDDDDERVKVLKSLFHCRKLPLFSLQDDDQQEPVGIEH